MPPKSRGHLWGQRFKTLTANARDNSMSMAGSGGEGKENSATSTPSAFWHGLGLFGESVRRLFASCVRSSLVSPHPSLPSPQYLLFSVGTLRPLWGAIYPSCFDDADAAPCGHHALTYTVVTGVMAGMLGVGWLAERVGRRRGSLLTASLMAVGGVCLTLCSFLLSGRPTALFPAMAGSLFVFGVGVGGEVRFSTVSAFLPLWLARLMDTRSQWEGSHGKAYEVSHPLSARTLELLWGQGWWQ